MNKKLTDTLKATAIVVWAFVSLSLFLIGADQEPTTVNGRPEPFSLTFIIGLISGCICYLYTRKWLEEDNERQNESPYNEKEIKSK